MQIDLVVKHGRVIDPANERDEIADVAIRRDRVCSVERDIPGSAARRVIDASGCIVTPGLIDLHAHVLFGFSAMSIDPDDLGPRTGVTTFVDPGTVGAFSVEGFRRNIVERSKATLFAFQNISSLGLVGTDYELARLEWCSVPVFETAAKANGDLVVGIKVRMGLPQFTVLGIEPLRRARQAADRCGLPIMVHIAWPPPSLEDVLEHLREGDIVTHCVTGLGMKLVDASGRVTPAVREARERGVRFDVGHGSGSFSFETAETLIHQGFLPDTISTDAHQHSVLGPMFDLATCMSKFLALGLDLPTVVRAATLRPVELLGLPSDLGRLSPGAFADIAIFELAQGDFPLFDFSLAERRAKQLLRNVKTIKRGRVWQVPQPHMPAAWLRTTPEQRRWCETRIADPRAPHSDYLFAPAHFDEPTPAERDATPLPREA